ncbi:hypothetical protein FSW04_09870 [Baekduia soli]|uniref:Uncharacterized protein n=1 Tax=Baekduia soli TaxID=496014 RepID=A0A5B8U439_9ACTN|nr:hypothetical protein [Baekduia soli]QEC47846.1 hypothetical protein FSW04_09870 [Baekduia soli]
MAARRQGTSGPPAAVAEYSAHPALASELEAQAVRYAAARDDLRALFRAAVIHRHLHTGAPVPDCGPCSTAARLAELATGDGAEDLNMYATDDEAHPS